MRFSDPLGSGHGGLQPRPTLRSFLVIDPDRGYLDRLASDPRFNDFAPVLCRPGSEAEEWLNGRWRFRAIFVASGLTSPALLPTLSRIRRDHPATPIFVIHSGQTPFSAREQYRLALHGAIPRPPALRGFIEKVAPSGKLTDTSPRRKVRKPLTEPAATQLSDDDKAYVAVAVEEFLHGLPSFFDVYIRVPSGKYLKILNAKEALDPERVLNFIELGTRFLYLRRSSRERCLDYCAILSQALASSPEISPELKLLAALGNADRLVRLLRGPEHGVIGELQFEYAQSYLAELFQVARAAAGDRASARRLVETFLRVGPALDHAISVSAATALLSLALGIETLRSFRQLGLAAIFHDLALEPGADEESDPGHALRSAKLLSDFPAIDEITIQAVAGHHASRNSQGTPVFAEVLGLADELAHRLAASPGISAGKLLGALEQEVFPGYSTSLTQACRAMFFA